MTPARIIPVPIPYLVWLLGEKYKMLYFSPRIYTGHAGLSRPF
jgi:hypothetical protein